MSLLLVVQVFTLTGQLRVVRGKIRSIKRGALHLDLSVGGKKFLWLPFSCQRTISKFFMALVTSFRLRGGKREFFEEFLLTNSFFCTLDKAILIDEKGN